MNSNNFWNCFANQVINQCDLYIPCSIRKIRNNNKRYYPGNIRKLVAKKKVCSNCIVDLKIRPYLLLKHVPLSAEER